MDFLIYSRARSATAAADDRQLDEQHWSYMDGFADQMTARGPTLDGDRQSWTGSMHVVDLPSPDAARAFVEREPYHLAGLYDEHLIWRFTNLLGRTMWQFGQAADQPRFLVLPSAVSAKPSSWAPSSPDGVWPGWRERLIVYGELRDIDGRHGCGVVLAAQAKSREALHTLLREAPGSMGAGQDVDIYDWEFGGRR